MMSTTGVAWFMLAVCAALPAVFAAQSGSALLTCYQCKSDNPKCSTTCVGRYCYRSELEVAGDKEKTVKTGCLNNTDDNRVSVGGCTVAHGELPGGGVETTERFCVCDDKAKCNTAAGLVRPCSRSLMTMLAAIYAALTVVRRLSD